MKKIYPVRNKLPQAAAVRSDVMSEGRISNGIYLDYAASTPVDGRVFEAMEPYFGKKFGNPGSLHSFGQEAIAALDLSRETVAKAIGADFSEIVFTGSATEANNLALRGVVKSLGGSRAVAFQNQNSFAPAAKLSFPSARRPRQPSGDQAGAPAGYSSKQSALDQNFLPLKIIVSSIEHESVLETARDLEKEGIEVVYLPVSREGFVDLEELGASLDERTILVSIMYVNNEIGTVQPIAKISKIIRDFRGTKNPEFGWPLLHTDAVQAFQYLDCDVNKLSIDLMTLSAHKIYGPKGIGALYVRGSRHQDLGSRNRKQLTPNAYSLMPIITGGGQEFGLRSGTENVPNIVGFARAVELVSGSRELENKRIKELGDYFWQELKIIYPKAELNGGEPNLPNILNIYFPNHLSEDLLIKLDIVGVAVSSGSACRARSIKPSQVLRELGLPTKRIKSSIRFSLGRFTTRQEIKEVLERIKKVF